MPRADSLPRALRGHRRDVSKARGALRAVRGGGARSPSPWSREPGTCVTAGAVPGRGPRPGERTTPPRFPAAIDALGHGDAPPIARTWAEVRLNPASIG